jgi:hypothetical protein
VAKASAFCEEARGPILGETLPQQIAVALVFGGIDPNCEGAKRSRNWLALTIYLIHGHKYGKVSDCSVENHQIGGVKKPRSLRLQSLLGFRYLTWIE